MDTPSPHPSGTTSPGTKRSAVVRAPGDGRVYPLGLMSAVFKADGTETGGTYSVSEWILEPHSPGPGAHVHEQEDDVFYVLEGTVTFILDGETREASAGGFVLAAAGVRHDFENRSDRPARLLNFYTGPFEKDMPMIADWYRTHPAQRLKSP